jgi:GT2 family glycosyltransferase
MEGETLHAGSPAAEAQGAVVDVVIVSADMGAMTLACVRELRDANVASIVVVDNAFGGGDGGRGEPADGGGLPGAGRGVGSERAALRGLARVLELERREGFAAANNRGVACGRAPYVLLLNSDVLVAEGAISTLLGALEADAGAVAAGGRLVDPQTLMTQPGYRPRPFPTLANFLVILLGIEERWPGNPISSRYHGAQVDEERVQAVAQPAAAALMVRRAQLTAVGGFDERFWFWFEDSDLLLRLSACGRVLYVPQAVFRHLGGGTFGRWSKSERIRSIHHGIAHYADAHLSRAARLALGVCVLAVSVPRIVLFARTRREETAAWRAVAAAGLALARGRRPPAIAP